MLNEAMPRPSERVYCRFWYGSMYFHVGPAPASSSTLTVHRSIRRRHTSAEDTFFTCVQSAMSMVSDCGSKWRKRECPGMSKSG